MVEKMGRSALTDEIKKETIRKLRQHVKKKYIGKHGVKDIVTKWKGRYLYIDWVEPSADEEIRSMMQSLKKEGEDKGSIDWLEGMLQHMNKNRKEKPSRLCRIHFTGNPEKWDFEIFKYSDNWYDTEGEFPFGLGNVEECFDAAASLYITETFP